MPTGTMKWLPTDYELLDRWRTGDPAAGNDLFRRHFPAVYRFFRDKVHGEADELIQATFLACVRARDQFRKDCSFRAFLFTLARHELYRYFRHKARAGDLDFSVTSLADVGPSPSRLLELDQRRAQLARAVRRLPLQQQLLIELHYWEDMRPAELGQVFEIAEATARVWLFRARQALRRQLEDPEAPSDREPEADGLDAWVHELREQGRGSGEGRGA